MSFNIKRANELKRRFRVPSTETLKLPLQDVSNGVLGESESLNCYLKQRKRLAFLNRDSVRFFSRWFLYFFIFITLLTPVFNGDDTMMIRR